MPTVYDFLGSALPWHERCCEPVVDALYAGDEPRAESALAAAQELLATDPALNDDQRRALEYILLEFHVSMANAFHGDAEIGAAIRTAYPAILALPPAGEVSGRVQAKVLLSLLGVGYRRGFIEMDEAQIDGLLARIPEELLTPNIWYYVVAWAFLNDNLRLLEAALEHQTVSTTGWNDDYYWLRTNLMYQLVSGKATRLDIDKTIRGYRHPRHIADFRNLFMARCEAAGLMEGELYALLERRETELRELEGTRPRSIPKTAHVVKQD